MINKPRLQRRWAELSLKANALTSEYRGLLQGESKVKNDLLLSANEFQEKFRLVDKAQVPQLPKEPTKSKFMGIGMVLTALIGLLLAVIREALRQTFLDATEFEQQTGLQVLATLPCINPDEES